MEKISNISLEGIIDKLIKRYPEIVYELTLMRDTISSLKAQTYTSQLFKITDNIRRFLKQCLNQIPALSLHYKRYLELMEPLSHHYHNFGWKHNKPFQGLHDNSTKMKQNLIEALKQEQQKSKKDLDDLYTGMSETLLRKQNTIQQLQRQLRALNNNKFVTFEALPNDLFKLQNQLLKKQINDLSNKIQFLEAQKFNNLQTIKNLTQNHKQTSPRSTLQTEHTKIDRTAQKLMTNIHQNHNNTPPIFTDITSNEISGWHQFSQRNITNPYHGMSPLSEDIKNKSQFAEQKINYGTNSNVKPDQFWRFIFTQSVSIEKLLQETNI